MIAAANGAFRTPEDGWTVENEGVPPDIEVEQTPAAVIAGRDGQLEKPIELQGHTTSTSVSPRSSALRIDAQWVSRRVPHEYARAGLG